jgi:general secretion pathway protein A
MLTGVFGCGKTLIAQVLMDELKRERYKIAVINQPQLDYPELLRAIVRNLKTVDLPQKKTEISADYLLELLGQILESNVRDRKDTVIIIDEAHTIEDEHVFEGLRLLLNFQLRERFLFTLLLLGQPELKDRIEDNKQLEQRIAIQYHLDAFNAEDTKKYIQHRLTVAGQAHPLFNESAMKLVHDYSGGIPRRINNLCDLCLLGGFAKQAKSIGEEIVLEEIKKE